MHEAKRCRRAVEVEKPANGRGLRAPSGRAILWGLALVGGLWSLNGCGEDDPAREAAIARAKKRKGAEKTPTTAAPPSAPASKPIFRFTEKPELAKVPDVPVFGLRDGAPMNIQSVVFEPRGDRWTLTFHDVPLGLPTGLIRGSLPLVLDLPGLPAKGERLSKTFGEGGALWRVPAKAANPAATAATAPATVAGTKKKPTTPASAPASAAALPPIDWRAPNAFALEITGWDVAPYADDGPAFQVAGKAAGRVVVIFKGEGSRTDSYVVGRFEDAVVRYMGRPDPKVAQIVAQGPKPAEAPAAAPDGGIGGDGGPAAADAAGP